MQPINPLWSLLVAAISALGGYVFGFRNATTAARALNLSIRKATPRIGSRTELRTFPDPIKPFLQRYAIHTTIYNDGDFVARNIEGEWKLIIAEGKKSTTKLIRADSLPTALPWQMNYELPGEAKWYESQPEVIFQVDIDLIYSGLDDAPQRYRARYHYDRNHKGMIGDKLS